MMHRRRRDKYFATWKGKHDFSKTGRDWGTKHLTDLNCISDQVDEKDEGSITFEVKVVTKI